MPKDMLISAETKVQKYSALPVYTGFLGERPNLPFPIAEDVSVVSLKGKLEPKHFELWSGSVRSESLKSLANIDLALVHRFSN